MLLNEDQTSADLVAGANGGRAGESKLASFLSVKVDELRVGFAPKSTGSRAFVFVNPDITLPTTATSSQALFAGPRIDLASPTVDA